MAKSTISLLPKQTEAYEYFEDGTTTELGYGGGAGGGKTRLGWYVTIPAALEYAGSRWGIGRKELKTLRMTTLKSGFDVINELGMKRDIDFKYNAQDGVFTFPNGSEIFLIDTAYSPVDPEYTRFGGYELTGAWIDESNETPVKAKEILKTRVGRRNKGQNHNGKHWELKPFFLETFNPDKGHVYQDYYKPWKESVLPHYRKFIPALPVDNPHLPEAYIENLRRADKITRERLLYGNFEYDDDPDKMFNYDAINDLFTNNLEKKTEPLGYIVCDVARYGVDKTVISVWIEMELLKVDIYGSTGIDETIDLLKASAAEHFIPYSRILVDEDGLGGGVVDGMRGIKGFMGNSRPLDIIDTTSGKLVSANFQNIRAQCLWKLAEQVNHHAVALKIDDSAIKERVTEELSVIKRKNADKDFQKFQVIGKNEIKEMIGRSPDLADVLMMRMYFELLNPKVKVRQIDPVQVMLRRNKAHRSMSSNQGGESMV